jgi:hypothetical protein
MQCSGWAKPGRHAYRAGRGSPSFLWYLCSSSAEAAWLVRKYSQIKEQQLKLDRVPYLQSRGCK